MKTSTVLKRALRLLDGGRRWIKGAFVGKRSDLRGKCYCAHGAILCAGGDAAGIVLMSKAIGSYTLTAWNDAPHRRWSHVEAAFKRAIKLAEKEERR